MANYVNLRIDPPLHKRVMAYCVANGMTLTQLIITLLVRELDDKTLQQREMVTRSGLHE